MKLIFGISSCVLVFLITVIRASKMAIHSDEVCTYIQYAKDLTISQIPTLFVESVPNNHWLNSIAIRLSLLLTGLQYNELVLRLPNLLCYAIYLLFCFQLLNRKIISYCAFCCLLFSYLINEYYGLARGYGFAMTLIIAAIYLYEIWHTGKRSVTYLFASFLFLTLAGFAITYSILWLPCFALPALFELYRRKQIKQVLLSFWGGGITLIVCLCGVICSYQYYSTLNKPLPPLNAQFSSYFIAYFRVLVSPPLLSDAKLKMVTLLFGIGGLATLLCFCKKILTTTFICPALIMLLLQSVALLVGHPLPTQRAMLIFYIPLVLAADEISKLWVSRFSISQVSWPITDKILSAGVVLIFFMQIKLSTATSLPATPNWRDSNLVRKEAYQAIQKTKRPKNHMNFLVYNFYRHKILQEYGIDIFKDKKAK